MQQIMTVVGLSPVQRDQGGATPGATSTFSGSPLQSKITLSTMGIEHARSEHDAEVEDGGKVSAKVLAML